MKNNCSQGTTRLALVNIPAMTLLDIIDQCQFNNQWSSSLILIISFSSQIFLICLQWLLSGLIPDHIPDGVFHKVQIPEHESLIDVPIQSILKSFERWDAVYFLHIAQFGYTYENTIAFFPLFPILIQVVAFIINHITLSSFTVSSCFLLSAILINTICFSLSSVVLYKLSLKVSNNSQFSCLVVLLFVFNPSRVFFIAPYSESLFSLTTFLGILSLYEARNFKACIFFALSVLTRSNGILNIGFIVHKYLCYIYVSCFHKRRKQKKSLYSSLVWNFLCLISAISFILAPFVYYQKTTQSLFCDPKYKNNSSPHYITLHAKKYNYVLPGRSQGSYCYSYEFPYSYVQRHYWNVGFLKYFQFKQIPNFLIAAPILLLIFFASYEYFIKYRKIYLLFNLQVFEKNHYGEKNFNDIFLLSYYLHLFFLALFCFLCIHVQVSNRMLLSSSPLVYFIVAKYVTNHHYLANYCLVYFCAYSLGGLILFTNYYPWT